MSEAPAEEKEVQIVFEPLPAYLQFYLPADQDAPNEMELALMHEAWRMCGPVILDACQGDAYKAARQVSIVALALSMRPGTYPDIAPKKPELKAVPGGKS
jgi:hypothetical protein